MLLRMVTPGFLYTIALYHHLFSIFHRPDNKKIKIGVRPNLTYFSYVLVYRVNTNLKKLKMKTEFTNLKNNLKKLIKVLGIGALLSFGFEANSQCIAEFTYINDSVNIDNVIFMNTSSNGNSNLTYSWDFGDGTSSNLENPNHVFTNIGTSTVEVCLTVSDQNGVTCTYCDSTGTGTYTSPACQAYFYSESDFNSLNGFNFYNYSGGTPSSFSWDFGDSTSSTLENPNHIFADSGSYQVCLTISDLNNNCQNTYCEIISVGVQPGGGCQAYFYSEPDFNSVNGLNFFNYSGGTANSYSWDFGDSTSSTMENPNHIFANTGEYLVCLTVADSVGTTCTYCEYVYVGQNGNGCQAYFYSYADSSSTNSINFSNYSSGTSNTYSWDFGDNTTSTLENPNHLFSNTGEYLVCLTIVDSNGTTCTYCEYIYVGQTGTECQAYFYSYPDSSSENSINFSNYSTGPSNTYSWEFGDGSTSNIENPNHVYDTTGVYQVCLTIADSSGFSCSFCENVIVGNDGCQAYFYSYIDSNTVNGVNFSNNSGGSPNSYFWDFGDSTGTSNLGNPNHSYADTGTYYACLTVVDQYGNACTYCDSVIARQLVAGIKESSKVNTLLENYPNPFNGSTTINYTISKEATVELIIVDLMGNKIAAVENGNRSAGRYSIVWNAENVSNGMYLLQLKVNDEISTKKIIITK